MPSKEWYTQQEIADMFGTTLAKVQAAVRALRRMQAINTTPDPRDERYILVHASGIEQIRVFLRIGTQPGDIA